MIKMKSMNCFAIFLLLLGGCSKATYPVGTYWCNGVGYDGAGARYVFNDMKVYLPFEETTPKDGQILLVAKIEHENNELYRVTILDSQDKETDTFGYLRFSTDLDTFMILDSSKKQLTTDSCTFKNDSTVLFPWKSS